MVSEPNASERKTKTVAGYSPIRVPIFESAFRERSSEDVAVVRGRKSPADAASVWTSTGRIQGLPIQTIVTRASETHKMHKLFPTECEQNARGFP